MARLRSFTLLPHTVPRRLTDPIVAVIARTGVTPNHLTALGFLGNVGAGVLAARGDFLAAGLVVLAASALDLHDGLFTRAERVLLLGGGLMISQVRIALWILAIMANATALQRLYTVWDRFRQDEATPPEERGEDEE